jgi:tetratricopeptide (TPR) repeat protein
MQIKLHVLEHSHAEIGECYEWIGSTHLYVRKDYDQALSNLKNAVEIQERTLPSDSLDLAQTYHSIASAYDDVEEYDFALKYFNRALKIRQKVLPKNHPKIAATYNNLGALYYHKQDYSKALEYYQKSLEIARQTLPPEHPNIAITENNIRKITDLM